VNNSVSSVNGANGSLTQTAVPRGTMVRTIIERGDAYLAPQLYNLDITLLEVLKGSEVARRIEEENVCDRAPVSGFEYVLAHLKFAYNRKVRGLGDEGYKLVEGQFFTLLADTRQEFPLPGVLKQPEPPLIGVVFNPGESKQGWVLLQVPQNAQNVLLVFKRIHVEGMYGIWGNVQFRLD